MPRDRTIQEKSNVNLIMSVYLMTSASIVSEVF